MSPSTPPCFVSPEKTPMTSCVEETSPLVGELEEYLHLNTTLEAVAAAHFLSSLGCQSLMDITFFEETDFRSHISTTSSVLPLTRSKLVLAHTILRRDEGLEELKRRMKTKSSQENRVIEVQVGEQRFTTNRRTLCRVEGSFLESLFSGRHECQRTDDGAYFIDRCGKHFSYVLDYLRFGTVLSLPNNEADKKALELEADYYGLEDLAQAIRMPNISTDAFLSEKTLRIQKNEQEIRSAYYNGESSSIQKHQGLIRLFADGPWETPIRYQPESLKDSVEILLMPEQHPTVGMPSTVSDEETFRTCFNRSHANVVHRLEPVLREEPLVIAGGSVLAALRGFETFSNDVDLFVCTTDPQEATRIAHRVWLALALDHERWVVVRSAGVINMHLFAPPNETIIQKVQVVLRLYESPAEVVYGFDCDCCACAYDGRDVYVTPRCYRSLETMTIIVNPIHAWPNTPSYELRLAKYAQRGFSIGVPGFDAKKVDVPKLMGTEVAKLKGLGRLVCIAIEWIRSRQVVITSPTIFSDLLRDVVMANMDPTKQLLIGSSAMGFYDDNPYTVLVPNVYCDGEPRMYCWMYGDTDYFPRAMESRDPAWQQIEHWVAESAGDEISPGIPHELSDAWSTWERSREYLNSLMDRDDVDNIYYLGAYDMTADLSE